MPGNPPKPKCLQSEHGCCWNDEKVAKEDKYGKGCARKFKASTCFEILKLSLFVITYYFYLNYFLNVEYGKYFSVTIFSKLIIISLNPNVLCFVLYTYCKFVVTDSKLGEPVI